MNVQDCLQLLREIKSVSFATVDEQGLPQVRIADVMIVEAEKLYFCTARKKAFYDQLINTKHVAIVGMNEKYQMVRLSGKVKKLDEQKQWIDRIIQENPALDALYAGETRYTLEPFCIENGKIEFFELKEKSFSSTTFFIGDYTE